jgi:hypothetical protein
MARKPGAKSPGLARAPARASRVAVNHGTSQKSESRPNIMKVARQP